ncbi:MAG: quinol:cytochrome C oxidoreductase [Chitinophagaceae bacterium]|nr:quinol:cytochrome C oxidoreductase [Chitinophagaceae bacterium]
MENSFVTPANYKKWYNAFMGVGALTLILGIVFLHPWAGSHGDNLNSTRFWAVLLQNSLYWLLLVNVAVFFIVISTLSMGGWQEAFRRVTEAVGSLLPVMAVITLLIMLCIILGHRTDIYLWLDKDTVSHDKILSVKKGFLNPYMYIVFSVIVMGAWTYIGKKLNKFSRETDEMGPMDFDTSRKWNNRNMAWSAYYLVLYVLSIGSLAPWLWMMSLEPHWYSTLYSWYTFASTFVAGMALITLFVIYFKNQGQLEYVNKEHLQDLGKYIFAFSIFWTYLWFDQFMLIWYGNIPEETIHFKIRMQGPYAGLFYLNLILNFIAPFLIFMKRSTKRNYTIVTFMAAAIVFGHWLDFYQMVMPGTVAKSPHLSWFEFGIALGFIGIIMRGVAKFAEKTPMTALNSPFLKESIVHEV